jgi:hypothetical protein
MAGMSVKKYHFWALKNWPAWFLRDQKKNNFAGILLNEHPGANSWFSGFSFVQNTRM